MASGWTLDDKGVVSACAACGAKNRVAYGRLSEKAVCGQCKSELPPVSAPIEVDTEVHFLQAVGQSALPVVVDFWAPWCGPCRLVAPEIAKVAASHAGEWLVVKVNTEALPGLGQGYGVQAIPTMAVFCKGQEVARTSGARPAAAIEAFVRQNTA